jgi:hypothetical protein
MDVAALNALAAAASPHDETSPVFAQLLHCCGSRAWVRGMLRALPVADFEALSRAADTVDATLSRDDWLEAFAAHPRVRGEGVMIHTGEDGITIMNGSLCFLTTDWPREEAHQDMGGPGTTGNLRSYEDESRTTVA